MFVSSGEEINLKKNVFSLWLCGFIGSHSVNNHYDIINPPIKYILHGLICEPPEKLHSSCAEAQRGAVQGSELRRVSVHGADLLQATLHGPAGEGCKLKVVTNVSHRHSAGKPFPV